MCLGYATQSLHFPWCQRRLNAPTPSHVLPHNDGAHERADLKH
jgi:hypothetical protein